MNRRRTMQRLIWGVILVLLLVQFIPVNRSNPPLNTGEDLVYSRMVPGDLQQLLQNACYDCHSFETEYPWYSYVAPVSFIIRHHIKEAREKVNFSIWNTYMDKRKDHTLDECIEVLEEQKMPLKSFTWLHPEARLSDVQREELIQFFKDQVAALGWREMGTEEEEEMENR